MLSGSGGVLLGLLGGVWLAQVVLWFTWLGLVWTVLVVQWTSALPGASINIAGYSFGSLVLTYAMIFGLRWRREIGGWLAARLHIHTAPVDGIAWRKRLVGPGGAVVMGACVLVIWAAVRTLPDGRLHLYFLDIGQGDGILIQTPSGRQVLIDGGGSPQQLFNELGAVMPFWDHTLDLVAVTNPDKDHMDAQAAAPLRYQVDVALETLAAQANPDADLWRANLDSNGAERRLIHRGGWIDLGDGVALWVLWPPAEIFGQEKQNDEQYIDNENSLVMKLVYGDFSVLLTGDAGIPAEFAMIADGAPLQATVLKAGHHGSSGSTSAPFVRMVNPQVAVIQAAAGNEYGHPHKVVLENLAGRVILRNDLHGRVHIYSDGQQMWIDTKTNSPVIS